MTKENQFFVDLKGNYIGEFSFANPAIPKDVIEVKIRPSHRNDVWDFKTEKWTSFDNKIMQRNRKKTANK